MFRKKECRSSEVVFTFYTRQPGTSVDMLGHRESFEENAEGNTFNERRVILQVDSTL
jgi:hypothetical protein